MLNIAGNTRLVKSTLIGNMNQNEVGWLTQAQVYFSRPEGGNPSQYCGCTRRDEAAAVGVPTTQMFSLHIHDTDGRVSRAHSSPAKALCLFCDTERWNM